MESRQRLGSDLVERLRDIVQPAMEVRRCTLHYSVVMLVCKLRHRLLASVMTINGEHK